MSYHNNREALVMIAMELQERGWKIFGFREDESDSMTDYWSPASWSGICEKNGYVLVVDNHNNRHSGYEVKKYNYNNTTYKASARIEKLEAMMNDPASTENEKASCAILIEKEKEKQGIAPTYTVIETYPTFAHGNPKNANWHIELNGQILAKGNGAFAVNNYDWEDESKTAAEQKAEKLAKFINKIEKVLTDSDALKAEVIKVAKTVTKPVEKTDKTINVGDILSFSYHGHFWIVTNIYTVGEQVRVTYELLGSAKRGYNRLSGMNVKRFYQPIVRLQKEMEEGKVKVYTMQEVTEYQEKTVFKKTGRKVKVSDSIQIETTEEIPTEEAAQEQTNTYANDQENNQATLNINNAKNGIEIKFTQKPSANIIAALKENGFKWSSFNSVWWTKQTADRLKFASMLVDSYNNIIAEEPMTDDVESVTEVVEVEEVQQVEQVKEEQHTFSFEIDTNYTYFDLHFKAWNYSVEDITSLMNITSINYYEFGEKFICTGLTLEQVKQVEMINEDNGAIIFIDKQYNELPVNTAPVEEEELNNNSGNTEEHEERQQANTEEAPEAIIINGKVKVKNIKFEWSESNLIEDKLTVNTFKKAEEKIRYAASYVDGGYDKTKFVITWTDGETYTGRIDIEKEYETLNTPIKDHITDWLQFLTGDNKPSHMTEEQYQEHTIKDENEIQSIYDFMKKYALTDLEPDNSSNVIYHDFHSSSTETEQEEQPEEEQTNIFDDILSKFDDIEVITEEKISAEDMEFCQEQETIYKQIIDKYNIFYSQLQTVSELDKAHGQKFGKQGEGYFNNQNTAFYYTMKKYDYEKQVRDIKNSFIMYVCTYFEKKYNVTIDEDKINKKYDESITYQNIVDEIFIQLDGFNFTEKAEQEIKQKLSNSIYKDASTKGNKLILNSFLYIDTSSKQWGTEKIHYNSTAKVEQLLNGLNHFDNGSTILSDELQSLCRQLRDGKNDSVFGMHELNMKKVKSIKIFKNGKVEIEFSSNQLATNFNREYCSSNVA